MGITDIADDIAHAITSAASGVEEMFEPTVRLGVTGLSRAGKTVFTASLAANLLTRERLPGLKAAADGRIEAVVLAPQPDADVPRFALERALGDFAADPPVWPEGTRRVSQLRLSFRLRRAGIFSTVSRARTVHVDLIDYPGEWLLDLPLLEMSFEAWSAAALARTETPARAAAAAPWRAAFAGADPAGAYDETTGAALAAAFTGYLAACRDAGLSGLAPGRFLMPGDLEGSPALAFAPLAKPDRPGRGSLWSEFDRRFEAYKRVVVKPFYRDHFSRLDRQIVLIDALSAMTAGPAAVADLQEAMTEVLASFRPGRNSWLSSILGKKIDRVLFAATKADHIHHLQHPRLAAIAATLMSRASERAAFEGAETAAMAIAGLRATTERDVQRGAETLGCVRGRLAESGEAAVLHPGDLPETGAGALDSKTAWAGGDFAAMRFAPPQIAPGAAPPHIRLDRALEFLLGDKLT